MKALTLWQPHAQLVALGVKTIETRSWATKYRGPLAIHAAERAPVEGQVVGDWFVTERPTVTVGPPSDRLTSLAAGSSERWPPGATRPTVSPRGAIVATCTLVDVVPIVCPASDTGVIPPDRALIDPGPEFGLRWTEPLSHSAHGWAIHQCEDQRPYGDYTPGRYAWLLADIKPHHVPNVRGRQGLWNWTPE